MRGVLLAFFAALRASELEHLSDRDVSLWGNDLHVDILRSKTGMRHVWATLPDAAVPLLREVLPASCGERMKSAAAPEALGIGAGRLHNAVLRLAETHKATLDELLPPNTRVTGHSLRKGGATYAHEFGLDREQIARRFGWDRGHDTLDAYLLPIRQGALPSAWIPKY
ncbi:MAG: hypothetical protein Rubg2KO_41320 [Rubricoccaceae bacterium]